MFPSRSSPTGSTARTRPLRGASIWPGWRFGKGKQKMDGQRALIYSRVRKNQLDAAENDLTRAGRQQAVIEAMTGKLPVPEPSCAYRSSATISPSRSPPTSRPAS